ncbi:hypothetical protein QJS10_CPB15g00661 [Acorus calamus]|uniref:Vacuolar iron transporter n=1 Tax=Acorus calamus TaxID=4465 RepID=A0AAV9D7D6_ACOCL|nr:hypothetical protein QJS10_CPB15g00661 [Acorus calamus]
MGFGDFMSSSTERDMAIRERTATERKVAAELLHPHHSVLLATYQALGMDPDDARMVVSMFSKYKDILVDEKMMAQKDAAAARGGEAVEERGAAVGRLNQERHPHPFREDDPTEPARARIRSESPKNPHTRGFFKSTDRDESVKFVGACVLSVSALALLGAAKARISEQSWVYSVVVTLFNGSVAAASAYLIRNVAGLEG